MLADTGARGEWLELELTERLLIDDIDHAPETLRALRKLGFSIAVDDFGVGYTSLAHLTELPLDKLKIDQSFVAGLPTSRRSIAVTQAVVQMAWAWGSGHGRGHCRTRPRGIFAGELGLPHVPGLADRLAHAGRCVCRVGQTARMTLDALIRAELQAAGGWLALTAS